MIWSSICSSLVDSVCCWVLFPILHVAAIFSVCHFTCFHSRFDFVSFAFLGQVWNIQFHFLFFTVADASEKESLTTVVFLPSFIWSFLQWSAIPTGSPSRGGNVTVYVTDQPSLPTPLYSVLVSISVFMALSTVYHSINSSDNSTFSHSVLVLSLCLTDVFKVLYVSLWKSPSALI